MQKRSNRGVRSFIIAVCTLFVIGSITAVLVSRHRLKDGANHARGVKATLKAMHDAAPGTVDRAFRDKGLDADLLLRAPIDAEPWNQDSIVRAQRVINDAFKPMPVIDGHITAVLPASEIFTAVLSSDEKQVLEQFAASVARVELIREGGLKLSGTAFVIGRTTAVTNCHVIEAESGASTTVSPGDLRLDFGHTNKHLSSEEFAVTAISPCSPRTGFDVAFLSVDRTSIDRTKELPAPLTLAAKKLTQDLTTRPLRVWLVGYPDLVNADEPLYQRIHSISPSYAKIVTPGMAQDIETTRGFDMVLHNGSSDSGNSGSPLIDLNGKQLLGVDHCCYDSIVREPIGPLRFPCAFVFGQRGFNESIASWEIWADPVLGPQLRAAIGR